MAENPGAGGEILHVRNMTADRGTKRIFLLSVQSWVVRWEW